MLNYEKVKEELHKENKALTKFFTREFYEKYLEEKQKSFQNYIKTGEWLTLEESEQSDFYTKNGYAWCRMLEIICEHLPKWRIDFIEGEHPNYNTVERRYQYFETKEMALQWAKAYKKVAFYEIMEVA